LSGKRGKTGGYYLGRNRKSLSEAPFQPRVLGIVTKRTGSRYWTAVSYLGGKSWGGYNQEWGQEEDGIGDRARPITRETTRDQDGPTSSWGGEVEELLIVNKGIIGAQRSVNTNRKVVKNGDSQRKGDVRRKVGLN